MQDKLPKAGQAEITNEAAGRGVVPVGGIIAFGGLMLPSVGGAVEWLPCDGRALSSQDYDRLYHAISTHFGGGFDPDTGQKVLGADFNLPDLRGRFLRGVDGGAGRDPDAAGRIPALNGGPSGDNVGSIQLDTTRLPRQPFSTSVEPEHAHGGARQSYQVSEGPAAPNTGREWHCTMHRTTEGAGAHNHLVAGGGDQETRPINIYVSWLIRTK